MLYFVFLGGGGETRLVSLFLDPLLILRVPCLTSEDLIDKEVLVGQ